MSETLEHRARLLPPASTPLERAIVETTPRWDALADLGGDITHNPVDSFKPWIAAELNLAQFAPYFDSVDALIESGRQWLLERGTAAALRRVLDWLGYDQATIEEDGPYLHLDLGRIVDATEIEAIRHVVLATLPAHMRFYRVFFAHDLRPIWIDRGPPLDAGLLDDDSGVWLSDAVPKASFSGQHTATTSAPPQLAVVRGFTQIRTATITYDDRAVLDAWYLDSQIMVDAYGGLAELFSGTCDAPTHGTPELASGDLRDFACAWIAPAPFISGLELRPSDRTPVPTQQRRAWSGAWSGYWRPTIPLTAYEET